MKVEELKKHLAAFPDDWEITFSGGLDFNRLKQRDSKMVNMEFSQIVYKDDNGQWVAEDPAGEAT